MYPLKAPAMHQPTHKSCQWKKHGNTKKSIYFMLRIDIKELYKMHMYALLSCSMSGDKSNQVHKYMNVSDLLYVNKSHLTRTSKYTNPLLNCVPGWDQSNIWLGSHTMKKWRANTILDIYCKCPKVLQDMEKSLFSSTFLGFYGIN